MRLHLLPFVTLGLLAHYACYGDVYAAPITASSGSATATVHQSQSEQQRRGGGALFDQQWSASRGPFMWSPDPPIDNTWSEGSPAAVDANVNAHSDAIAQKPIIHRDVNVDSADAANPGSNQDTASGQWEPWRPWPGWPGPPRRGPGGRGRPRPRPGPWGEANDDSEDQDSFDSDSGLVRRLGPPPPPWGRPPPPPFGGPPPPPFGGGGPPPPPWGWGWPPRGNGGSGGRPTQMQTQTQGNTRRDQSAPAMSDAANGMYGADFSTGDAVPPLWGWGGGPGIGPPKQKRGVRGSGPEWGYGGGPVIGGSKRVSDNTGNEMAEQSEILSENEKRHHMEDHDAMQHLQLAHAYAHQHGFHLDEHDGIKGIIHPPREVDDVQVSEGIIRPRDEKDGAIIHPPRDGNIIHPPRDGAIIHPPRDDQIIHPPRDNAIIHPPRDSAIIHPPRDNAIIHPPRENTIIHPPRDNAIIHPPRENTIIHPPRDASLADDKALTPGRE